MQTPLHIAFRHMTLSQPPERAYANWRRGWNSFTNEWPATTWLSMRRPSIATKARPLPST